MIKKGQQLQDGYSDLPQNCRVGRSWHAAHFCNLNLTSISYSFWNIRWKILKLEKKKIKKGQQLQDGYSDLLQNCRVCRSWHTEHVCSLNSTSISYSFWNKGRTVLQFRKFDEKRAITPKWVMGFTSKLQGR